MKQKLEEKRCIVCKKLFIKNQNRQMTCSPECKKTRHHQMNKKRYRSKVNDSQIEKAKKFLELHGYSVIPINTLGYRIILEPIEKRDV